MTLPRLRITVALDPAAPREEVLEAAHALSGGAAAEITALFVEDDNLDRLAALPGARQVVLGASPRSQALDAAIMRRQLALRAARVRRTCDAATARLGITPLRFLVRRGRVIDELTHAGARSDLLVVGRSLRTAATRSWLGIDPLRLMQPEDGPAAVLFVHEPWRTGSTVVAITTGRASDERVTARAALVAQREALPVERVELRGEMPEGFAMQCRALDARVLVMPAELLGEASVDAGLLRSLLASVLVVR